MRQNELMVGDWVKLDFYDVPYGDEEEAVWKNGKITAIHHGNWVDVNFGGRLDECDIEVEDIRPIPLTHEVLIKIGFEKFKSPMGREYYEIPMEKAYIRFDTDFAGRIQGPNGNFEYKNIMFVHELQHAFRMLGIEREIEL